MIFEIRANTATQVRAESDARDVGVPPSPTLVEEALRTDVVKNSLPATTRFVREAVYMMSQPSFIFKYPNIRFQKASCALEQWLDDKRM